MVPVRSLMPRQGFYFVLSNPVPIASSISNPLPVSLPSPEISRHRVGCIGRYPLLCLTVSVPLRQPKGAQETQYDDDARRHPYPDGLRLGQARRSALEDMDRRSVDRAGRYRAGCEASFSCAASATLEPKGRLEFLPANFSSIAGIVF